VRKGPPKFLCVPGCLFGGTSRWVLRFVGSQPVGFHHISGWLGPALFPPPHLKIGAGSLEHLSTLFDFISPVVARARRQGPASPSSLAGVVRCRATFCWNVHLRASFFGQPSSERPRGWLGPAPGGLQHFQPGAPGRLAVCS
jgi:hypothetical protein